MCVCPMLYFSEGILHENGSSNIKVVVSRLFSLLLFLLNPINLLLNGEFLIFAFMIQWRFFSCREN